MKTYYMVSNVTPSADNLRSLEAHNFKAHVWIADFPLDEARALAKEYLATYHFEIVSVAAEAVECALDDFVHSDILLKCYRRAQRDKVYAYLSADGPDDRISMIRLKT